MMLYSKCLKLHCKNKTLKKVSKSAGNENHHIHRNFVLHMNTDFLLHNILFIKLISQYYRYGWKLSY